MARNKRPPRASGKAKKADKAWEPTERQLAWYYEWAVKFKGPTQIALEATPKVSRQLVHQTVHKVAEYMRSITMDRIMSYRERQTAILEDIARKEMEQYEATIGEVVVTTETTTPVMDEEGSPVGESITTQTKTSYLQGDTAHLNAVMAALKSIREIWGVNAPVKTDTTVRHGEEIEGLPMGQGHPTRSAALLAAAKHIEEVAKRQAALEKRQ